MKKRIISVLLIIVMLLLPFSMILNANATIQTEKGISYDDTKTNGEGYKITSVSEDGVVVNDIGANNTLGMYKILDVYYDNESNQISYGFTSNFNGYAEEQSPKITVNDYLNTSYTTDTSLYRNGFYDPSEFNQLVSKYAIYARANNIASDYSMITTESNGSYSATKTDVEAGVYVILPTSVTAGTYPNGNFESLGIFAYGVMIANVVPTAAENNNWQFTKVEINAKKNDSGIITYLIEEEASNFLSAFAGLSNFGTSLNYKTGENYSYVVVCGPAEMPANAHRSIRRLDEDNILSMGDITYSSAFTPDLTEVYSFTGNDIMLAKIENNKYYISKEENGETTYRPVADVTSSGNTLTFEYTEDVYAPPIFNLTINQNVLNGSAEGNTITTTTYAVKDPYVDVGSDITRADIRVAFDTNDANYNSTKSVNIRKGIEKIEKTVTLYTTGITVNNTNSNNTNLNGAEFAVYSTYENGTYSNQLGNNIVINNGTGLLNGLDPKETYYLKQVKAPSGYRIYDDKIIVIKGTNDETDYDTNTYEVLTVSNGMYTANVVNSPILALPFTGGAGTIIYTVIGLVVVAGAITFIIIYKKKNKKDNQSKE